MTPALVCMLAWCAGVSAGVVLLPQQSIAGWGALLGAVGAGCSAVAVRPAVVGLALAGALLGVARAQLPAGDPSAVARAPGLAGLHAVVAGEVADDPRSVADGFEVHIPRGYIYFAMAFAAAVEAFNVIAGRNRRRARKNKS